MANVTFTTPEGRYVSGDFFKGFNKDFNDKPYVDKDGNPRTNKMISIAIPKTDPAIGSIIQMLRAEARSSFPTRFDTNGNFMGKDFAWKFVDGDSPDFDAKGKRINEKEGYRGCYILSFSSFQAPTAWRPGEFGLEQVTDPDFIKFGDWVQVNGSASGNDNADKPGLYLNLNKILFKREGERIIKGMSAEDAFAQVGVIVKPQSYAQPQSYAPPALPQQAPQVPSYAQPAPPPNTTYMAPPPVTKYRFPDGKEWEESALLAQGWTLEALAAYPKC